MRRVHRYYNRYPHGSLEGFATNYAYRYVKRRIISVIVGIVILIIFGIILASVLCFAYFRPDLDSYGTNTAGAAYTALGTHDNSGTDSAIDDTVRTGSAGVAAGSAGIVDSSGIFDTAGAADSSGICPAGDNDADTASGKSNFDVKTMFVKKDMGDEIGTINASSRWQKFHVFVGGDYSNLANFRISVPGTGYLIFEVNSKGKTETDNFVLIKADGFEGPEYLTPKRNRTYIGVSKGIYTISARSVKSEYDVRLKFKKIKEGKFGITKTAAPVIKKYRSRKGILATDKHPTHWYKIKHSNTRPIRIKAKTLNSTGGHGGIQVSLYQGGSLRGNDFTLRNEDSINFKVPPYKNARYLDKGIYYIKVESYLGGNGYYSIKWK